MLLPKKQTNKQTKQNKQTKKREHFSRGLKIPYSFNTYSCWIKKERTTPYRQESEVSGAGARLRREGCWPSAWAQLLHVQHGRSLHRVPGAWKPIQCPCDGFLTRQIGTCWFPYQVQKESSWWGKLAVCPSVLTTRFLGLRSVITPSGCGDKGCTEKDVVNQIRNLGQETGWEHMAVPSLLWRLG